MNVFYFYGLTQSTLTWLFKHWNNFYLINKLYNVFITTNKLLAYCIFFSARINCSNLNSLLNRFYSNMAEINYKSYIYLHNLAKLNVSDFILRYLLFVLQAVSVNGLIVFFIDTSESFKIMLNYCCLTFSMTL